jgi:hypothetical protein
MFLDLIQARPSVLGNTRISVCLKAFNRQLVCAGADEGQCDQAAANNSGVVALQCFKGNLSKLSGKHRVSLHLLIHMLALKVYKAGPGQIPSQSFEKKVFGDN